MRRPADRDLRGASCSGLRACRRGRLRGPHDAARGAPGPADRAHERSDLGADRCAVDRGSRLLQPPGDDDDAGGRQVLHRPVELGQALVGGGTGEPGGRRDVREDRVHRAHGPAGHRRAPDRPASGGLTEDDPAIGRKDRVDRDLVTAGAAASRRRFPRHGRQDIRADLQSLRRREPGQGEESTELHTTG